MHRTTTSILTMFAVAIVAAPAVAAPGNGEEHLYVLGTAAATLTVEVHYTDGVSTTKFAFVQLAGANGGPGERLKPTPECTEWIGTFSEAAAMVGSDDAVANSTIHVRFDSARAPLTAPRTYVNTPLDLEVFSSVPGGLSGRILTCDQAGDGLLKMSFTIPRTFGQYPPALVRVNLEGSS